MTNVIQACCDFLERQLDPSNAIGIANFAEQHGCGNLCRKANQYIERHFSQVRTKNENFPPNNFLFSSDLSRRGIPPADSPSTNNTHKERRAERAGRKGSLQCRIEVGEIRRRQQTHENGEHTVRGPMSVSNAEVSERPNDELRRPQKDAGLQGVFGSHLPGK